MDIANLENYCNCNTLYLNNNLIRKIEGLSHLSKLTFLYLSGNKIQKIEGLEGLTQLNVLDLSSNLIEKIENISHLTSLQNLNVASNLLKTAESLSELPKNQSITCLNLSNNPLEAEKEVYDILGAMSLLTLYMKDTLFSRGIPSYRKETICHNKKLTFLDEKPVTKD